MRLQHLTFVLSSVSLALAWTTYIVPHSSGGDDTPALTAAFSSNPKLLANATILFQKGLTYNLATPLEFPSLQNVIVSVQGNLTYGSDIQATQAIVAAAGWARPWITFTGGTNIRLQGSTDPQWGWIDANGQKWWDAMKDVSSRVNRPQGVAFQQITNGDIKNLKIWKPIAWNFGFTASTNIYFHNNTIMAISDSSAQPSNTDGFNVQGTNIIFENNVIYNGDDCLAICSPADNIVFRNNYCNGGHGLSIIGQGANGIPADIKNIMIENVVMENSIYAARYKSVAGSQGTVSNVTWRGITLNKVRMPILVTENYWDNDDGSEKTTAPSSNTFIDGLTFDGFHGTLEDVPSYKCESSSCWYGVKGSTGEEVIILDVYKDTTRGIFAKNINVTTVSKKPVTAMCDSSTITYDVGFKCQDGAYVPTA